MGIACRRGIAFNNEKIKMLQLIKGNTLGRLCPPGTHPDPLGIACLPDAPTQQCPPGYHHPPLSHTICVPDAPVEPIHDPGVPTNTNNNNGTVITPVIAPDSGYVPMTSGLNNISPVVWIGLGILAIFMFAKK